MDSNIKQRNNLIKEKRDDRKERIKADIELYGHEVLESDEMKNAYDQTHHIWSTLGEHTIRVTATSVLICYVLRKLHIKVSIPAVVIGALCHDLGMLDRGEKPSTVESVVVSVADKYTAVKDLVKGSDANDTGVNNTVRRYKDKVKNAVRGNR